MQFYPSIMPCHPPTNHSFGQQLLTMNPTHPTQIQSGTNGSLDLFTGIFYMIRILGAGSGIIRPSAIPSANGGIYLEQDIFSSSPLDPSNSNETQDYLWYFEPSSTPSFYEWGVYSEPKARVVWTAGDDDNDDFPLQLRNMSELAQDIYEDPSSSFWDIEPVPLSDFGYYGAVGYQVRPMNNLGTGPLNSITFAPHPKSPMGVWLQLNNHDDGEHDLRSMADHLLIFEPQNFKLYAVIGNLDVGGLTKIKDIPRVKEFGGWEVLKNPTENETTQSITQKVLVECNLYVRPNKASDLFSGVTVISPSTTPSRKYFDLEKNGNEIEEETVVLNLKANKYLKGVEEIQLQPFTYKNVSSYVTYLKDFKGIQYVSWADVSAVADMMSSNGRVVKNVLVEDVNLLKHLIRARGYLGEFRDVSSGTKNKDAAQIRIRTSGSVWGSYPLPIVQFEEGHTTQLATKL